jgi:hypothetical protein
MHMSGIEIVERHFLESLDVSNDRPSRWSMNSLDDGCIHHFIRFFLDVIKDGLC